MGITVLDASKSGRGPALLTRDARGERRPGMVDQVYGFDPIVQIRLFPFAAGKPLGRMEGKGTTSEEQGAAARTGAPGMAKAPGYQLPADVADFANRYQEPLTAAIENRMRQVGIPDAMVGIKYYGVDEGAFVRYKPPQLGGNIRRGTQGQPGINVDPAVFDANAPKVGQLPSWRSASLKDRIDVVLAHEYTEVTAPQGVDGHLHALKHAENTPLKISDRARQILREHRQAEGY